MTAMTLPKVPTDNLYKFMAIFGLLVFGLSWSIPKLYRYELLLQGQATFGEYADIVAEGETIQQGIGKTESNLKDQFNQLEEVRNKIESSGCKSGDFDLCDYWKTLRKEYLNTEKDLANFKNTSFKWQAASKKIEAARELYEFLKTKEEEINHTFNIGMWCGGAISSLGFILWFFKLQRYQDKTVLQRAESGTEKTANDIGNTESSNDCSD